MGPRLKRAGAGILTLVFSAALILGIYIPSFAEETYPAKIVPQAVEGDYTDKLVILHSNDVHGAVDGYPKIAALKTAYETMGAEVILVDCGDYAQGTPYVSQPKGLSAVELMNAAGYNFATMGNHEFDFGVEIALRNLEKAVFQTLCANVFRNGEALLPSANAIYNAKNGVDVGFFGLDTPESVTKANPALMKGITIPAGKDMADIATEQAKELKENGAETVIALTHLGVNQESAPDGNRSLDLYKNSSGIDLILDGHSHTVMTEGTEHEPIQSTGTLFAYIGVVVLDNQGAVEDHYLVDTKELASDAEVKEKTDQLKAEVDKALESVIGKNEVELEGAREVNRVRESNHGDFITDSMLWYVETHPEVLDGFKGPVVSIINGGAIRDKIPTGDVTMNNIQTVHPFGNTVGIVYVKGSQLLEALEASTFSTPEPLGGYPQTGNIRFTIDTTKKYDAGEHYPNSTYHKPASINRVSIQSVGGNPFDPEEWIAVVTTDFVAGGGDTFYAFSQGQNYDLGVGIMDCVIEYIQLGLNGVIPKSKYGAARGDQTQILEGDPADEPTENPDGNTDGTIPEDPDSGKNPVPEEAKEHAQSVTADKPDHPKTGDTSDLWIWIIICGGAVITASSALILMKRKG